MNYSKQVCFLAYRPQTLEHQFPFAFQQQMPQFVEPAHVKCLVPQKLTNMCFKGGQSRGEYTRLRWTDLETRDRPTRMNPRAQTSIVFVRLAIRRDDKACCSALSLSSAATRAISDLAISVSGFATTPRVTVVCGAVVLAAGVIFVSSAVIFSRLMK